MSISKLSPEAKALIGQAIRDAIEEQAISQEAVAAALNVDPRTVRAMLAGRSLTVPRLKELSLLLEKDFMALVRAHSGEASTSLAHGGYLRHQIEDYEGDYVAVRHSLSDNPNFHCSFYSLKWNEAKQALHFQEENRFLTDSQRVRDYSQGGHVYISQAIGLFHLLTAYKGAIRLITLSKMRFSSRSMYGGLLTQSDQKFGYMPAMTPIVFRKIDGEGQTHIPEDCGPIQPSDASYEHWREELDIAELDYVSMQRSVPRGPLDGTVHRLQPNGPR